jgi:tetratricopeptide (TPR) repeat protein
MKQKHRSQKDATKAPRHKDIIEKNFCLLPFAFLRAFVSLWRNSPIWVSILFPLFFASPLFSQRFPDATIHARILTGIDLTLQQRYPEAKKTFQSIIAAAPAHPAGYIYLAATLQAECSDFDLFLNRAAYDSLIRKGFERAETMIAAHEKDQWGYYYAGTALAYKAFTASEEGSWYTAVTEGMKSAEMFERALACDGSFANAMCGLGTYNYWKSRKTQFLSWLPFVGDKRTEGINLLKNAAERSTYETSVARNSLMWVMIEEKRYGEALKWAEDVLARYPDNRSFLWGVLTAHERLQDSTALRQDVERLLISIVKAPVRNIYGEITCRLKLAQFAVADGDAQRAEEQCDAILRYATMQGKTHRDIAGKLRLAKDLAARVHVSNR